MRTCTQAPSPVPGGSTSGLLLSLRQEKLFPPDLGNNHFILWVNNTLVMCFLTPILWDPVSSGPWASQAICLRLISEAPPLHRARLLLWTSALTFVSSNWVLQFSLLVTGAPFLDGSPPALGWTEYLPWCCLWRPMCHLPRPRLQGQPCPAGRHPRPPFTEYRVSSHDKG